MIETCQGLLAAAGNHERKNNNIHFLCIGVSVCLCVFV